MPFPLVGAGTVAMVSPLSPSGEVGGSRLAHMEARPLRRLEKAPLTA